jgi:L-amino acid N-acyltransferase YncA
MVAVRRGESHASAAPPPEPLRILIDTNVYIALEPFAGQMEKGLQPAARLLRLAAEQGHKLFVHPAVVDDLKQGTDPKRTAQRLAELSKFMMLDEGPIPSSLTKAVGASPESSNDHRDLRLLAALANRAVTYLVTEDGRLRKRAQRYPSLAESVMALDDFIAMLEDFAPAVSATPPRVERVQSYTLDEDQAIFDSIRSEYAEFDSWLTKVKSDSSNRICFVIRQDNAYAALAILKAIETDCSYGFSEPVCKIATLKVEPQRGGSKLGELLLKAIFSDASAREVSSLYVEVHQKHKMLIELLELFGFFDSGQRTERGELVMVKTRTATPEDANLGALEYHVRLGPPAINGRGQVFMVPIQPQWHEQLFPDAPGATLPADQLLIPDLLPEVTTHPWGNALRKAYLSQSRIKRLKPGDTLLFYRSRGPADVLAVGVVESTLRSPDPSEVMTFVGRRTVYTPDEIARMARRVDGVLAILFRQDRFLDHPWTSGELQANGVMASHPQTISQVEEAGATWVHRQLIASP